MLATLLLTFDTAVIIAALLLVAWRSVSIARQTTKIWQSLHLRHHVRLIVSAAGACSNLAGFAHLCRAALPGVVHAVERLAALLHLKS